MVLNAKDLSEVARAPIPVAVPFGFHGNNLNPNRNQYVPLILTSWRRLYAADSAATSFEMLRLHRRQFLQPRQDLHYRDLSTLFCMDAVGWLHLCGLSASANVQSKGSSVRTVS